MSAQYARAGLAAPAVSSSRRPALVAFTRSCSHTNDGCRVGDVRFPTIVNGVLDPVETSQIHARKCSSGAD